MEALPNGQRWLLNRVLKTEWLQEEFLDIQQPGYQVQWKIPTFLELLLLLCHITGGQPARGTEILSLRHRNTVHRRHRSIFIEQGLVSTVTSYHKGYHVTGSTKIIHRYLPQPVSEMMIYYLWLILPFCEKLEILAFGKTEAPSPFLWPKAHQGEDSSYLSKILEREARQHLQTKWNITYYRHAAIAISRAHLLSGGFKRDYGVNEKTAGTIYARAWAAKVTVGGEDESRIIHPEETICMSRIGSSASGLSKPIFHFVHISLTDHVPDYIATGYIS
ncbi:conserved hypothetical protein [Talaromyces stipitatus ATCC 10500]|uniref:Uncharacterized protein n=1 Tax=Talaromyces stipitatus (strain ATCC 10500 / CBS 375.48 / QM 6759 / NRRL 1006) TaxID=441959 RepID=B8MN79_TALSN|nr:uncharacterized protein TSTA_107350 [Talaromyces stipitatus ATCC 10500]EED14528.1 conserved hypothetical protein [Talaromyces stipitatus ATCC 10500]